MRRLLPVLLCILIVSSCKKDPVELIDIFAKEDLKDPVSLDMGQTDKLMVNADRIEETPDGFHIKGTIFSESVSGTIPVTSGDFIMKGGSASAKGSGGIDFNGYGTSDFPTVGLFSSYDAGEIPGSEVWYNKGSVFKSEPGNGNLPLLDEKFYFRHRIDKAGKGKDYRMKNITLKLREFYLDPRDPASLFVGDIYTEKAGVKRLLVENGAAGISANELWEFVPYTFSNNLETITGGTGFQRMNGGVSLSGLIPVKKYPVKILGQAVINTSFSSHGASDFFERGFDDASFRIGVNGKLFFTHELVKFLTGTDTVSLGKATLQADFSDDSFNIRMAGEYSDNILERFLGPEMMSFIPYHSNEGVLYLRGSDDPDEFLIYLEEKISVNIPGLGTVPMGNSVFTISADKVGLSGTLALPYNIGNVNVTGIVNRDGTFLLKGRTDCNIDLGSGMVCSANIEAEISQNGVKLSGTMNLPQGVGTVNVTGGLTLQEIYFSGLIRSSIPFPVDASVNTDLQVSISSIRGINLRGSLDLPGGIGSVSVSGTLSPAELLLTGTISSGVSINFGDVDVRTSASMSLSASSVSGVVMRGSVSLPFSIGDASVSAGVTRNGLWMSGSLGSHINITGYPLFDADMSVSASTTNGMRLYGDMKFPGNFGWINVSGKVSNSGYNLGGSISSASIDFYIVELSTSFSVSISNTSGIDFSGSGSGCIDLIVDELCTSVGVGINIDYYSGSVELCIDFPIVGDACIGW